ncbi:diaminopimelate decarboxylase [Halopelagius longus]|uniref:Diaminopimelate decarboxylase n=1 Tax=Halopelagius longus TaxID=1236180 RepID=A0A1H1C242_9EURY|nr:diaminopimelate decarboxylase [Halopelagius longus]RDI71031.1 diaminopimelate decarboxylase [Halopelagius longus]SDQ58234.1 diaminopimelate decarboxylase [Halopelagius longus]
MTDPTPTTDSDSDPAVRRLGDWDAVRLRSLAEQYDTPAYVIDLDRIRQNYRRLSAAFEAAFDDPTVMFAVKAHSGRAVIETLLDEGVPMECAAAGEVFRALRAGADPDEIQYTGVNPPDGDLDYVVGVWEDAPGMTFNVGAEDSVERLAERGFDGRLCLRVNPGIAAGHHEKVKTGAHPKFGIPYDSVPEVAERVREEYDMDLVGLHAHAGSGMLDEDMDAHAEYVAKMGELAREVGDLEFLDIGGGFGVPYRDDEDPLDIDAVAERTAEALGDLDATLKIEPGRYLLADAGCLLATVNTVKDTPETTVVGIDASMTTLIRPAMYDAYHGIRNLTNPDAPVEPLTVGGPVCESSDTFCRDRPLPRPDRGDVVAIGHTGAYGYAMASQFHSQPRPVEIALEGGEARVARRRETFDDLVRLEE